MGDEHMDRRHKWTFERVALALTLVTSVIAFVFGLGVNWSRITQQEARIEAFERAYLRADVYAANQQRLTDSIDRLTVELQALREQPIIVDASVIPRERTTPRQKFDR